MLLKILSRTRLGRFFTVSGCYRFDLDSHPGAVFIGLDSGHKMRSVIKILDIKVLSDL